MKTYSASLCAIEYDETIAIVAHHTAAAFRAENEQDARSIALAWCDQVYPNYEQHTVNVVEIPQELL